MDFHYSPRIVKDGLVLYLDGANTRSYSGTGSTWYDLVGDNNGSINGTYTKTFIHQLLMDRFLILLILVDLYLMVLMMLLLYLLLILLILQLVR